jgi:hypothetical protein
VRTIEVRRDGISRTRAVTEAEPRPADGQAVLRVERFSLSANNVTYARLGEELGYWRFFPAADGWGRLPVWAYAEVIASNCAAVSEGRHLLGFFPMSDYLLVTLARLHAGGFAAGCEHRRDLPGLYNAYRWLDADPSYDPALADQQLVLRPSFWLSFLFDEHLRDNHDFGADIAIISSASSKAALGIAHLLAHRFVTIGLTAPQRAEPLRALGIYDRVEAYEAASDLPAEPAIFADLAGDTGLRAAVRDRLGGALRHSALLGTTRGALARTMTCQGPGPSCSSSRTSSGTGPVGRGSAPWTAASPPRSPTSRPAAARGSTWSALPARNPFRPPTGSCWTARCPPRPRSSAGCRRARTGREPLCGHEPGRSRAPGRS